MLRIKDNFIYLYHYSYIQNMQKIILNEHQVITEYLSGENCYLLGEKYNCSHSTIINILKRHNIDRRKISDIQRVYSINKNYFKIIDTPDKAYFLGLFYADGCMHKTKRSCSIALQESDCYILEKFKEYLKYDIPLYRIKPPKINHKPQYRLAINCENVCKDLISLGVVPAKSLILKFPTKEQVSDKFIWSFIRGATDGDGCLSLHKRGNGNWEARYQIIGSKDFILGLSDFLKDFINSMTVFPIKASPQTYNLMISNKRDILNILSLIYKDKNDLFFSRKFEKSEAIIKFFNDKPYFYTDQKILQYSKENVLLKEWKNLGEIIKMTDGYTPKHKDAILKCLAGKSKSSYGYKWVVKNE